MRQKPSKADIKAAVQQRKVANDLKREQKKADWRTTRIASMRDRGVSEATISKVQALWDEGISGPYGSRQSQG